MIMIKGIAVTGVERGGRATNQDGVGHRLLKLCGRFEHPLQGRAGCLGVGTIGLNRSMEGHTPRLSLLINGDRDADFTDAGDSAVIAEAWQMAV
jgi:hypothetical protein